MSTISLGGTTFTLMQNPMPMAEDIPDVEWKKTPGNKERAVLLGPIVRKRGYRIHLPDSTAITAYNNFISGLTNYSTTFTLVDHDGVSITSRILAAKVSVLPRGSKFVDIEMMEVL